MKYTIAEIKNKIKPIAKKCRIPAVYLFGSYAKGSANENSDVDLLFDLENSKVKGWGIGDLHNELENIFPAQEGKEWGFDMMEMFGELDEKNILISKKS
jgi:predicted nucleotidyltransferase